MIMSEENTDFGWFKPKITRGKNLNHHGLSK